MKNNKLSISRYPGYKSSGVEWLGEVPEHWNILKTKTLCSHIRDGTHGSFSRVDVGYPLLSVRNIVNSRFLFLNDDSFISEKDYQTISKTLKIKEADLQLAIVGATMGKVALVPANMDSFVTQRSLATLRPIKKVITSNFFLYFVISSYFQDTLWSNTSYSAQPGIYLNTLSNINISIPPLPEQKEIAHYLDTKTAQIDRKIDLLTQKAERYGNLKQSLINETVMRGLDRSVSMKDSGIEWIGDVPEHWQIRRLKDLSDIQNSNVDKKSHNDEISIRLCNYVDVYKNEFISASLDFMEATANKLEIKQFVIKNGDVFITKDSETCEDIAVPALAIESLEGVLCGYHLARLRTNERKILGSYLFRLFQSKSYGFRFVIFAKGITRVGLGQSAIADSLTPVPPLSEQKAIADYLNTKTAQIDRVIQTINTQIEKLKELRKALINDVVRGKIKVV